MLNNKTDLICKTLATIVAFVCITYAAIYFQKPSLLWWYIVPLFIIGD